MPQHTEEFQLKKLLHDHTKVINQHHTKSWLFYHDPERRKYVVNGGERTKKRLQFLLENDRYLKKALREDAEDLSNYIGNEVFQYYKSNGGKKKRIVYKKEMEPLYWKE